jgi:hypothetical protein
MIDMIAKSKEASLHIFTEGGSESMVHFTEIIESGYRNSNGESGCFEEKEGLTSIPKQGDNAVFAFRQR